MGQKTGIGWCDSTVNNVSGCDGCELWHIFTKGPCYAGFLHEGRLAKAMPDLYAADFTEVRMIPGRMAKAAAWPDLTGKARPGKPWLDGMPRLIFVDDMGDIFSEAVTFDFLKADLIDVALSPRGRRHIWMILTKRPSRAVEFAYWLDAKHNTEWPANIWAGTSITSKKTQGRADILSAHPAPVKFLSVEPMRSAVDFAVNLLRNFQLVIYGGESRQGAHEPYPCDLAWIRAGIAKCREAEASVFVKQLGARPCEVVRETEVVAFPKARPITLKDSHGEDWNEWPEDLRVREMPALTGAAS